MQLQRLEESCWSPTLSGTDVRSGNSWTPEESQPMEDIHCDHNSKCASGEGEGGLGAGRRLYLWVLTTVHIALCPSYPVSFWLCPVKQCIEEMDSAQWRDRRGESFQQGQHDFITHGLHQPEWYKFSSFVCRMPQSHQGSLVRAGVLHLWYTKESPGIL